MKPWPYNNNRNQLPYVKESKTSKDAADSMKHHAPTTLRRVFDYIEKQGPHGSTDDEIEAALDLKHQTASARRRDLEKMGLITKQWKPCGTKYVVRKTRSGRNAGVYIRTSQEVVFDQKVKRGRPKKAANSLHNRQASCLLTNAQWADLCCLAAERGIGTGPTLRAAWIAYAKENCD